ncbi:MAG TPA: hypothetical protein VF553_19305 [Pyrinomonadaceae bacterium]|jgi:hypothetical protein
MKEFLLSIISGVAASLIVFLVTTFVSDLSRRDKWLVSGLIGLAILAIVAAIFRRSSPRSKQSQNNTAWDIEGGKVRVENINVSDDHSDELNTAGRIRGKESADVSGVTVKRGGKRP